MPRGSHLSASVPRLAFARRADRRSRCQPSAGGSSCPALSCPPSCRRTAGRPARTGAPCRAPATAGCCCCTPHRWPMSTGTPARAAASRHAKLAAIAACRANRAHSQHAGVGVECVGAKWRPPIAVVARNRLRGARLQEAVRSRVLFVRACLLFVPFTLPGDGRDVVLCASVACRDMSYWGVLLQNLGPDHGAW